MHPGENLILATAGSVGYRVAHHPSGPELEADMGVGWTISVRKVFVDARLQHPRDLSAGAYER